VLHLRPSVIVETGVARGVTSRFVIEGLDRNNHGQLWSIDLPHLFEQNLHAQTAAAIPDSCRSRWTYIEGSSRRRLPSLLRSLGQVELFIHDSLHTADAHHHITDDDFHHLTRHVSKRELDHSACRPRNKRDHPQASALRRHANNCDGSSL
jgi:hypothetical protein